MDGRDVPIRFLNLNGEPIQQSVRLPNFTSGTMEQTEVLIRLLAAINDNLFYLAQHSQPSIPDLARKVAQFQRDQLQHQPYGGKSGI